MSIGEKRGEILLTEEEKKEVRDLIERYPKKMAASVEALKILQEGRGWVPDEEIKEIARILEMDPSQLDAVATFYSTIFRRPVGRHVIMVCDSISCWVLGFEEIVGHLKALLGIQFGETTPDNRFTLLPVTCLGLCEEAPAMMVDDDTYGNLTPEKIDKIIKNYE
jgi:NADH-quinone oxidoreductase subunit E